jgi:acetyltransferase-like isoleucine patch superfamily enzyme
MTFRIGKDVEIHPTARINVEHGFIGDRSVIQANVVIEGREVRIGNEARIREYARIGGGSCFEHTSILEAGDWLHLGNYSLLNQGKGMRIGHECACGVGTRIFTHGAYESTWDGFPAQWGPVSIGNRVFLPYAVINPNVSIGDDVVVATMSLVNRDLPSGCLAGGVPCKILKENAYPRKLSYAEKQSLFERIFSEAIQIYNSNHKPTTKISYEQIEEDVFSIQGTTFDLAKRTIDGPANEISEVLKNQLRRNGIRFRYYAEGGVYVKW